MPTDNALCREEQGNESETHDDSTTVGSYQLKGPLGRAHTATAHEVRERTACHFTGGYVSGFVSRVCFRGMCWGYVSGSFLVACFEVCFGVCFGVCFEVFFGGMSRGMFWGMFWGIFRSARLLTKPTSWGYVSGMYQGMYRGTVCIGGVNHARFHEFLIPN